MQAQPPQTVGDGAAERPVLMMPPDEAGAVRAAYDGAGTILEYGCGGSTAMAAEMTGKTVFSVESDATWLGRMRRWFEANPPRADRVVLHHADIGPTRDWGHPADESRIRRWPGYANSVWDHPGFEHPDVVLIDGRFRAACLITVALRIVRPVLALFDDYRDRKPYHRVEELVRPSGMIGRMARFDLEPRPVPADRLGWIASLYLRPL
ncbi:MAG: hypothetical protein ACK4KW_07860 [Gemmobacter sp.]